MSDVMIEVDGLTKDYGPTRAVDHVTFSVRQGEVLGFLGPNGAGKSTTMKILTCFLSPTDGRARVAGHDVFDESLAVRQRIGYLPEDTPIYRDMTVLEFLEFAAAMRGMAPARSAERIKEVGIRCGLGDVAGKLVGELSKGFRQRVGLAQAMLHDPDILILDEPTSGLDPRARIEVREILKELSAMGKTILISSHILHELSQLCTRIGILEAGKLATEGSLQEIYRRLGLMQIVHAQVISAPADLAASLRRLPGVESVDLKADRLSIRIRAEVMPPEDLLDHIRQLGARVRMFQPEAMELETAFLKLTEGQTA